MGFGAGMGFEADDDAITLQDAKDTHREFEFAKSSQLLLEPPTNDPTQVRVNKNVLVDEHILLTLLMFRMPYYGTFFFEHVKHNLCVEIVYSLQLSRGKLVLDPCGVSL